uniref:Uncharacterized protein n=1 Tax=Rhizophora mucronata TaxID=61149 RepID=A0A2P2N5L9_RHIMU
MQPLDTTRFSKKIASFTIRCRTSREVFVFIVECDHFYLDNHTI